MRINKGAYIFIALILLMGMACVAYAETGDIYRAGYPSMKTNEDGAADVFIQDQFSPIVDLYLHEDIGNPIILTTPTALDDFVLAAETGHGAAIGNLIYIEEGLNHYQGGILAITATSITVDSPLDTVYSTDAIVKYVSKQMAVDGSSATRTFHGQPPVGLKWDITRIIFFIEGTGAMDSGKFGDIDALINGIVLRTKNGDYQNIFNVKSNGDFANEAYDITYDSKAPAGTTAVRVRRSVGGQDKNGVVIRLDCAVAESCDELQIPVRDDISDAVNFFVIFQGHEVVD